MTSSPKHIGSAVGEGTSVPAEFTLPHNTHWSMADAWGLSKREREQATYTAFIPVRSPRPTPARVPRNTIWSDEATDTLRRLWALGSTCSRIAKKLGRPFTRSAVAAKARRLGLPMRKYQAPRGRAA